MCGRFTITVSGSELAELLGVDAIPNVRPRYNVAPSQTVLAARVNDAGKHGSKIAPLRESDEKCLLGSRLRLGSENPAEAFHSSDTMSQRRHQEPRTG